MVRYLVDNKAVAALSAFIALGLPVGAAGLAARVEAHSSMAALTIAVVVARPIGVSVAPTIHV